MSALAIAGAAALQSGDALTEGVAGAEVGPVALSVIAVLLLGLGVGGAVIARAVEERLLGPTKAGPRVFLWADVVLGLALYLFGVIAGGIAIGIAEGPPGEGVQAVEDGIEELVSALREDPDEAGPRDVAPGEGDAIVDDPDDGTSVVEDEDADAVPGLDFVTAFTLTAVVMGLVAAYLLIAGLARRGGAAALGLRPRVEGAFPGARPITAVARYLATLPLIFAAGALLHLLYIGTEGGPPQQAVAADIAENLAAHPVFTILFAAVLIPILEEVIFRGFLLELFAAKIGAWGGIVLSSLIFAALHGWPAFGPILVLAVALGWIKLRTGSLYGPMLVHMLHNGSQVLLAHLAAR